MSDSSQRKLECGLCFLPQGAERRNNHQGDQILTTNSLQKCMEISQEKLYLYSVA